MDDRGQHWITIIKVFRVQCPVQFVSCELWRRIENILIEVEFSFIWLNLISTEWLLMFFKHRQFSHLNDPKTDPINFYCHRKKRKISSYFSLPSITLHLAITELKSNHTTNSRSCLFLRCRPPVHFLRIQTAWVLRQRLIFQSKNNNDKCEIRNFKINKCHNISWIHFTSSFLRQWFSQ